MSALLVLVSPRPWARRFLQSSHASSASSGPLGGNLVPPQLVLVSDGKAGGGGGPGGRGDLVTTMGIGSVKMNMPQRAHSPQTAWPDAVWDNVWFLGRDRDRDLGLEVVAHRGQGHQAPPQAVGEAP
jgi:hypothetical protein